VEVSKTHVNDRILQFYRNVFADTGAIFDYASRECDLNAIQWRMLTMIQMMPEVTIGDLSRISKMNKGNCSTMCKDLERQGYLTRSRNREDERVVSLTLTDKGCYLIESLARNMEQAAERTFGAQSHQKLEELFLCMAQVEEVMHALAEGCQETKTDSE
jgi:DNA-binding MarR family transcriptional regulator